MTDKPMNEAKRARLEAAGFKVGTIREFLELTPEENALVEIKLAMSNELRQRRQKQSLSQTDLANRLKSSQSRIAKMEAGEPGISFDLMLRALLAVGASREDVGRIISAHNTLL